MNLATVARLVTEALLALNLGFALILGANYGRRSVGRGVRKWPASDRAFAFAAVTSSVGYFVVHATLVWGTLVALQTNLPFTYRSVVLNVGLLLELVGLILVLKFDIPSRLGAG